MSDKAFKIILWFSAIVILVISGGILYSLASGAIPAFKEFGFWNFISSAKWDPTMEWAGLQKGHQVG